MGEPKLEEIKMGSTQRYLEFILGNESYAVELLKVKEVITPPLVTPIPQAPSYVCGLMNLRGIVLTITDLRKKLGITPNIDRDQNAVIIFDLGERMVGVVVDSIQRVLSVDTDLVKPPPHDDTPLSKHIKGVIQQENKLIVWVEPKTLIDEF